MTVVSVRALLRDATITIAVISVHVLLQATTAAMSLRVRLRPSGIERRGWVMLIIPARRLAAAPAPAVSDQAETIAASLAPGLIESRRKAENARAENRTTPLEVALKDLDGEKTAATSLPAPLPSRAKLSHFPRIADRPLRALKPRWTLANLEGRHSRATIPASRGVLWRPAGSMSGDCLTRRPPLWP